MTTTKNKPREEPNSSNMSNDTNKEKINELDTSLLTRDGFCDEIVLALMENR